MLEFVARLRGQTITTVVERAISAAADEATIPYVNPFDQTERFESWRQYWDVIDGIRELRMAAEPKLHPSYDEERRLAFARRHWPFFYEDQHYAKENKPFVYVLWPRIEEFIKLDDEMRRIDYFAAGRLMVEVLEGADLKAPTWPPIDGEGPTPAYKFDKDIPF